MNKILDIGLACVLLLLSFAFMFSPEPVDLNNVCTAIYTIGACLMIKGD